MSLLAQREAAGIAEAVDESLYFWCCAASAGAEGGAAHSDGGRGAALDNLVCGRDDAPNPFPKDTDGGTTVDDSDDRTKSFPKGLDDAFDGNADAMEPTPKDIADAPAGGGGGGSDAPKPFAKDIDGARGGDAPKQNPENMDASGDDAPDGGDGDDSVKLSSKDTDDAPGGDGGGGAAK